jgi:hypothetical protein
MIMTEKMTEISNQEFWDNVNCLPPLLRLGYSDGAGAFISSEPCELRRCAVTGKDDYSYDVSVVLKNAESGEPQFFGHNEPLTVNEFMALGKRIMPGVGICQWPAGETLLDEQGNLHPRAACRQSGQKVRLERAAGRRPPMRRGRNNRLSAAVGFNHVAFSAVPH